MSDTFELARAVVPLLNQSPFNKQITLVGFDQLGPNQLLALLTDVFKEISADYSMDPKVELPENIARRVLEALVVLGFKVPEDQFGFVDSLKAGSKDAIYPVLLWLLNSLSKHRVKAYLAKFLVPLALPEEIAADEVYQQYKQAMEEFREVHKRLTTMRDEAAAIVAIKAENARLLQERATLNEKLSRAKKKVNEVHNSEILLAVASEVRSQIDERRSIAEQLSVQKDKLMQAKEELARAQDTLKEVKAAASVGPSGYAKQLEEELATNRYALNQDLPQEAAAMKEWRALLEEVLSEPSVTEASRAMLHQELTQLRSQVKDLTAKRAARQQPSDEQLGMYRQQVAVVERKKDEIAAQLKTSQDQLDEVRRQHQDHQKQFEAKGGDSKMLAGGGQLDAFVESVKAKAEEMKRIKAEMSDTKAESGILSRTKDILISKHPSCREFVEKFEAKGVSEPKPTEERLEEVSQKKQEVEDAKGKTLQELTKVLAEIGIVLQEKRAKLAPLAKQLRTLRTAFQEVESIHSERKKEYESLMLQIETDRGKTELETRAYREDWLREETRYHTNQCALLLINVQLAKAAEKTLGRSDGNTYIEVYTAKAKQQSAQTEILRTRQATLKETSEPNLQQTEMFTGLKKLMLLKLELMRKPKEKESTGTQDASGADHLVIS